MESLLQIFYLAMAVYGWISWKGYRQSEGKNLEITSLSVRKNFAIILFIAFLTSVSGFSLDNDPTLDYLDAFTTWGAIIATFMVAKKILENWLYWIVIDAAAIYLYLEKGLYLTALLFAAYILIALAGYIAWCRDHRLKGAA